MKRWKLAASLLILFAAGVGAAIAISASETTGTVTAAVPDRVVTIPGTTNVVSYTIPTVTQTVTVTSTVGTTTVPTTTTAPTTTAPPPICTVSFTSGTSLNTAVTNTPSGGTGCLHQGTYSGTVTASKTSQTTIRSYPGETATVTGNNDFHGANYTLSSLRFVGAGGGNTIYHGGTNINITNSDITNNNTSNSCIITGDPGYQPTRSTGTIAYNIIHNCGSVDNLQHCVYEKWTQGLVVTHNVFYGCHTYADQIGPDAQGDTFSFNTVDGTGSQAGGVLVWSEGSSTPSSGNDVHDNIIAFAPAFTGFHASWSNGVGSNNQVHHNCFFQNLPTDIGTQTGFTATNNITGQNPLFTDRAGHNYTLQPGSPCAGKGAT